MRGLQILKDSLFYIVLALAVGLFLTFFKPACVDGSSMYPTYEDRDLLLLRKTHDIKRGDIVAVKSDQLGYVLCKRVIGLPNECVKIDDALIKIDGKLLDEPYITESFFGEYLTVVGKDKFFAMGDNRNNSTDSRQLGTLDIEDVEGVVIHQFMFNQDHIKGVAVTLWVVLCYACLESWLAKRKEKKQNKKQQLEVEVSSVS